MTNTILLPMKNLINDYKLTRKHTSKMLLENCKAQEKASKDENIVLAARLNEDASVIRSMINSLTYSIRAMESGILQNARDVSRRAGYEREILVENERIHRNQDKNQQMPFETDVDQEAIDEKKRLASEIASVLDATEKEVFMLAANEFSQREIAKMLEIPRTTVQTILNRCKRKISEEGWVIV